MSAQAMMRNDSPARADSYWREKTAGSNPIGDIFALAFVLALFVIL